MFRSIFSRMTGSKSKDAKGESEDDSSSSSSSSSSDSSSDSDDSDNDDNSNKGDALPVIPSFVFDKTHLMGAAGFPLDITAMYYHSASQVLCVGTSAGLLYIYGSDFQSIKLKASYNPIHTHSASSRGRGHAISRILGLGNVNRILVLDHDGNVALHDLPSCFQINKLSAYTLLNTSSRGSNESITAVHIDEEGEKEFLYIGTSTGRLLVVECNDELRIVDYVITPTDLGMGGAGVSYWVADLRICPKDDKYIAVGYCDHADEMKGYVVIIDMAKKKVYRKYEMGVTSLGWDSEGKVCYVGNNNNEIWSIELDRQKSDLAFSYLSDRKEGSGSDNKYRVTQLCYLHPQSRQTAPCVLALFTHISYANTGTVPDHLDFADSSIVLCLMPDPRGTLSEALTIPPVSGAVTAMFSVLPIVSLDNTIEPAVLLSVDLDDLSGSIGFPGGVRPVRRTLRSMCLPRSDVKDWVLETGMLPEPGLLYDQMHCYSNMTVITAVPPSSSSSSSFESPLLLYLEYLLDCESSLPDNTEWHIPLLSASYTSNNSKTDDKKDASGMHMFMTGHESGLLSLWAVSSPPNDTIECLHRPLEYLQPTAHPITTIAVSQDGSMFAVGDEQGAIYLYRVSNDSNRLILTTLHTTRNSAMGDSSAVVCLCLSITNDNIVIIASTFDGRLWYKTSTNAGDMLGIALPEILPSIGTKENKCVGLHTSTFKRHKEEEEACYCLFETGEVLILSLLDSSSVTPQMVAYGCTDQPVGRNLDSPVSYMASTVDDSVSGTMGRYQSEIHIIGVLDGKYKPLRSEMDEEMYGMLSSTGEREGKESGQDGNGTPCILAIVRNKILIHYNLAAFTLLGGDPSTNGRGKISIDKKEAKKVGDKVILSRQSLSDRRILSTSITLLRDRGTLEPYMVLLHLDDNGTVGCRALSPHSHPAAHASLLNDSGLFMQLSDVAVLGHIAHNGMSIIVKEGCLFTVMIESGEYANVYTKPPLVPVSYMVPNSSGASSSLNGKESAGSAKSGSDQLRLVTGREDRVHKGKREMERRRSSMFNMGFATDLYKVFLKTRPEAKIGAGSIAEGNEEEDEDPQLALKAEAKSRGAMASMMEARRNLEQRGEKLSELSERGEALMLGGQAFRNNTNQLGKQLKSKRWSLFK